LIALIAAQVISLLSLQWTLAMIVSIVNMLALLRHTIPLGPKLIRSISEHRAVYQVERIVEFLKNQLQQVLLEV
jgi:hypothetical protein